jgi:hypothetical protein
MRDEIGVIDTLRPRDAGASITLNSVADRLSARTKSSLASTVVRDSIVLHKILVIGEADWESKFVVAALEEEGWKVDALIRVAPGIDVAQGLATVIDTSRYSAVVALDGGATTYANRIMEFARTGGGVVLGPQAASIDAMALLRAGAAGRATSEARGIQAGGAVSQTTLALAPITSLRSDAIPLERRAGAVAVAARRIGAGRLVQLGYEDTWRLRMGGADGAVRDHRMLWTRLVSGVAYAPRVQRTATTTPADEAPIVGLVAAIGPRVSTGAISMPGGSQSGLTAWLFLLLSLALVGEVLSRRLRGES